MDNRKDSIVAQVAGNSPEEVVAMNDHKMEGMAQKMGETEFVGMLDDARDATNMEHSMTIREAVKLYPYAVMWSILASTALVMEGYDLVVIGSFYGFRKFSSSAILLWSWNGVEHVFSSYGVLICCV